MPESMGGLLEFDIELRLPSLDKSVLLRHSIKHIAIEQQAHCCNNYNVVRIIASMDNSVLVCQDLGGDAGLCAS